MKQHIEAFNRILNRIRDYVEKLGRKTLAKRCLRVLLASMTKEDLAAFRRADAHMIFMTSNICAIRLKMHDAVQSLNKTVHDGDALMATKEDMADLRREVGNAQMETASNVARVDNAVRSLSKILTYFNQFEWPVTGDRFIRNWEFV
ncbi:hypothetical protein PQX77_014774 [Marasmius sp. AFHP31]|nr:hypothetical protein PQX77_014774 [Marasmius sp. AFHP31]